MTKIMIISIVSLFTISFTFGQDTLEYYFSKDVHKELDKYVQKQLNYDKSATFFLILRNDSTDTWDICIDTVDFIIKDGNLGRLFKNTNRIVKSLGMRIPVILETDFRFVAHGFGKVGIGNHVAPIKTSLMNHGGYYIKFNSSGKVLKTGY